MTNNRKSLIAAMRHVHPPAHHQGAAAVEMALVLPIFLTVCFAIIEFGNAMMAKNMATIAAFEGARLGIIDGSTNDDVTAKVKTLLTGSIGSSAAGASISVTVVPAAGNTDPGNQVSAAGSGDVVTVTVQLSYDSIAMITGKFLSGRQMTVKCTMNHE